MTPMKIDGGHGGESGGLRAEAGRSEVDRLEAALKRQGDFFSGEVPFRSDQYHDMRSGFGGLCP